jgi:hypothetical protein
MPFENGSVRTLRRPLILFAGLGAVVCSFSPIDANVIDLWVLEVPGTAALIRSSQSSDGTFFTLENDGSPVRLAKLHDSISVAGSVSKADSYISTRPDELPPMCGRS